jgi:hypothetical protein
MFLGNFSPSPPPLVIILLIKFNSVASLLYMRPCPISLVVASETAQVVYIPAYKLHTMLETDTLQAADLYQHSAQALDRQITKAVGYLPAYKRVLLDSLRSRSDSGSSLHSESSTSSTRERSDSSVSEGALDSPFDSGVEPAPEPIKQQVVA